jgi:hypothetical protein
MPSSLFTLIIKVDGKQLKEYTPEDDDTNYPSPPQHRLKSARNDKISYVEATPGKTYTLTVKYHGPGRLSTQNAYSATILVDGEEIEETTFYDSKICHHDTTALQVDGKKQSYVL